METSTDDVPVFRGVCTCEHPDYDHTWGSCDEPPCDCQAGWVRMPYEQAKREADNAFMEG